MKDKRVSRFPLGTCGHLLLVIGASLLDCIVGFERIWLLKRHLLQNDPIELNLSGRLLKRGEMAGTQAQTMPTLISAMLHEYS